MNNCPSCGLKISIKNENTHLPFIGLGKLSDGQKICAKCYLKLKKINRVIAKSTKKHTLEEINKILNNQKLKTDEINDQLISIGFNKEYIVWGRKELEELPNILSSEEKIKGIISGDYNNNSGILVTTSTRILFIHKHFFYGLKIEDFRLDKITTIKYERGIVFASINIIANGNVTQIKNINKIKGKSFTETTTQLLLDTETTIIKT